MSNVARSRLFTLRRRDNAAACHFGCVALLGNQVNVANDERIRHRNNEQGKQRPKRNSTDDDPAYRLPGFRHVR